MGPLFRPALATQRYRLVSEVVMRESADIFIDAGCNVGNLLKSIVRCSGEGGEGGCASIRGPCVILGLDLSTTALSETMAQLSPFETCPDDFISEEADGITIYGKNHRNDELGDGYTDSCDEGGHREEEDGSPASPSTSSCLRGAYVALLECDLTQTIDVDDHDDSCGDSGDTCASREIDNGTGISSSSSSRRWPPRVTQRIVEALAIRLQDKLARLRRNTQQRKIAERSGDYDRDLSGVEEEKEVVLSTFDVLREDEEGQCVVTTEYTPPAKLLSPTPDGGPQLVEGKGDDGLLVPSSFSSSSSHPPSASASAPPPLISTINVVIANIEVLEHIHPLVVEQFLRGIMINLPKKAVGEWVRMAIEKLDGALSPSDVRINVSFVLTTPNGEINETLRTCRAVASSPSSSSSATNTATVVATKTGNSNRNEFPQLQLTSSADTSTLSFCPCPWMSQYRNLRHNDHYFELNVGPFGVLIDFMEKAVKGAGSFSNVAARRLANLGHVSRLLPDDDKDERQRQPSIALDEEANETNLWMCGSHGVVLNFSMGIPPTTAKDEDPRDHHPFPFKDIFGSSVASPTPLGDAENWKDILTEVERSVREKQQSCGRVEEDRGGEVPTTIRAAIDVEEAEEEENSGESKRPTTYIKLFKSFFTGNAATRHKSMLAKQKVTTKDDGEDTEDLGIPASPPEVQYWTLLFNGLSEDAHRLWHAACSPVDQMVVGKEDDDDVDEESRCHDCCAAYIEVVEEEVQGTEHMNTRDEVAIISVALINNDKKEANCQSGLLAPDEGASSYPIGDSKVEKEVDGCTNHLVDPYLDAEEEEEGERGIEEPPQRLDECSLSMVLYELGCVIVSSSKRGDGSKSVVPFLVPLSSRPLTDERALCLTSCRANGSSGENNQRDDNDEVQVQNRRGDDVQHDDGVRGGEGEYYASTTNNGEEEKDTSYRRCCHHLPLSSMMGMQFLASKSMTAESMILEAPAATIWLALTHLVALADRSDNDPQHSTEAHYLAKTAAGILDDYFRITTKKLARQERQEPLAITPQSQLASCLPLSSKRDHQPPVTVCEVTMRRWMQQQQQQQHTILKKQVNTTIPAKSEGGDEENTHAVDLLNETDLLNRMVSLALYGYV